LLHKEVDFVLTIIVRKVAVNVFEELEKLALYFMAAFPIGWAVIWNG
jgi:hypothetical protein